LVAARPREESDMSKSANVLSIQTLKDFKVAMINFSEDARNSLSGCDMELRRMRDWLERDQLGYWQAQIKKREEQLMQARADLHKRKISQQGSDAVSDAEQKENLREATRRLRVAEEKYAAIKKLIPYLHHEIDEYHSHSQPLGDHLAGGFEKSLFILEKMTKSLEAYLALQAPTAPSMPSAAETGASATTSSASTADSSPSVTSSVEAQSADSTNGEGKITQTPGTAETAAPAGEPVVSGRAS
jgi:hypothetical protein